MLLPAGFANIEAVFTSIAAVWNQSHGAVHWNQEISQRTRMQDSAIIPAQRKALIPMAIRDPLGVLSRSAGTSGIKWDAALRASIDKRFASEGVATPARSGKVVLCMASILRKTRHLAIPQIS
jgi:hypothetical protein